MTALQARLQKAVRASPFTYAELEERSGVTVRTISNYMSRHPSMPTADKLAALCRALGISADWVLGLEDRRDEHGSGT